jgi:PAS domain S-box-containing protein
MRKKSGKPSRKIKNKLTVLQERLDKLEGIGIRQLEKRQKMVIQLLEILNHPAEKAEAIRKILLLLKEFTGFEAIGIRLKEDEDFPYYLTNGFPEDFILAERYLCARHQNGELIRDAKGSPVLECMCGNIIRGRTDPKLPFFTNGGSFWSNCTTKLLASTTEKERQANTRNRCNAEGYESVALIPLRVNGDTIGLLQFNDTRENMFTPEMINFFERIGVSIGIAFKRAKTEEDRYKNTMDNMLEGCQIIGFDWRYIYINPAAENHNQRPNKELIGNRYMDMWTGIEQTEVFAAVKRCLEKRVSESMENEFTFPNGQKGWFELSIQPVPQGVFILSLDITERKKAEKSLAVSEIKYRRLFEAAKDGIIILDAETGQIIDVNKFLVDLLGFSHEQFLGKKIWEIGFFKDIIPNKDNFEELQRKEYIRYENMPLETAAGKRIEVEFVSNVYLVDNKKVIQCNIRNITERKKAEQSLKESEERFRAVFDTANDGILVASIADKKFYLANKAICQMLGYSQDEIKNIGVADIHPKEDLPHVTGEFEKQMRGEIDVALNLPVKRKDGTVFYADVNASSLKLGNKEYLLGIFRNITERKKAEEETRKHQDIETAINSILNISLKNIPLEDILKKTLETILAIPWLSLESRGAIFLAEEPNTLVMKAQNGIHPELLKKCNRVPFGKCICGKAALSQEIQFCDKINHDHETSYPGIIPHGHYCAPITFGQKTLGVINLYVKEGHQQDKKEMELLSAIANMLAGIIQRKQAEKQLAQNEEKFRSLIQNLSDIIIIMNDKMIITYLSPSVERVLGYKPEELIGKEAMGYVHPNDIASVKADFVDALKRKGTGAPFSFRLKHKNGNWIYLEALANNLLDNPIIRGIVANARDITAQYLADEEMKKLSSVVEQTADLVVVTDKEGFIQYANPAFQRLTGYTEKELAGKTPRILKSERYDKTFYENLWQTILSGKPFSAEFTNRKKNGKSYYEEKTITPVKDARGIITSFVSIGSDITAQKNMETQLLQSQKMEAIGSLAGGIAHDFNNVLTTIQGYTDLVMDELGKQSPLYGDMEHIKSASLKAGKLTQQLLLFSRKKPRELANIDIHKTINGMLPMLKPMIGETIKISPDLEANPSIIKADEGNMEQVVMNIVINARDAMPKGGVINIKTENASIDEEYCKSVMQARPGEFVCISITDGGTGIDKKIIPNIFEPFFTTKEKGKGTGLGLATVYGIVKQHNGWINVYSELGQGSTFKVYLPSEAPEQEEMPFANDGTRPGKKKKSEILTPEKGNGEKILLVEDDDGIREFAFKVLGKNGYAVSAASTVKQALDIFLKEKGAFDLLLSDMVLPDKNGLELASQLRLAKPTLPIIIASGYTDGKIEVNGFKEKGYKFIQKPYNTIHLLKMIKESIIEKTESGN